MRPFSYELSHLIRTLGARIYEIRLLIRHFPRSRVQQCHFSLISALHSYRSLASLASLVFVYNQARSSKQHIRTTLSTAFAMAQAFNAQLPQPNFGRIAQMHVELSTELEKCQNIPAVHQGNEILQALQQLQNQLQTRFDQMQDNITGLRNEVGDLRGEINTIKTRLSAVYVPIGNHSST